MICNTCGGARKVIQVVVVPFDGTLMPEYDEFTCPECMGAGTVEGGLWDPDQPEPPVPTELRPEYIDQIPF